MISKHKKGLRAPKKKKKTGKPTGRPKGMKNKKTLVHEFIVSEAIREMGITPQTKPAVRLHAIGMWCESKAAIEQKFPKPNEEKTLMYIKTAISAYTSAAPYFDARLSAVMVKQDDTPRDETVQVTLKIGDRTERIINREDGSQVTVIEHDEEEGERLPN